MDLLTSKGHPSVIRGFSSKTYILIARGLDEVIKSIFISS